MKKRFFAMFLVLALALSLATGVSAAENGGALVLDAAEDGGKIVLTVSLKDCGGVSNGRFGVEYDASAVTLVDWTVNAECAMSSVNDENAGVVHLAWIGSDLAEETTLMLTLEFRRAEGSTEDLTLTAAGEGIFAGEEEVEVAEGSANVTYVPEETEPTVTEPDPTEPEKPDDGKGSWLDKIKDWIGGWFNPGKPEPTEPTATEPTETTVPATSEPAEEPGHSGGWFDWIRDWVGGWFKPGR